MDKLRDFYADKHMRAAVFDGLRDVLHQETVSRALSRRSTEGMADAKDVIQKFFADLDKKYGQKSPRSKVNEAE